LEASKGRIIADEAYPPVIWPLAHYYLGLVYEQSGDRDKAVEYYSQFLDCWKEGDETLKIKEDARKRLGELQNSHRQIKPYWTKRFAKISFPFELRLLNGMNPPVPEVTVLIHRITKDRRAGEYRLHIKKVLGYKHWDKRRRKPRQ
jgi:hypothetical protein